MEESNRPDQTEYQKALDKINMLEKAKQALDKQLFEKSNFINSIKALENIHEPIKLFRVFASVLKKQIRARSIAILANTSDTGPNKMRCVYQEGDVPAIDKAKLTTIGHSPFWTKVHAMEPFFPSKTGEGNLSYPPGLGTDDQLDWVRLISPIGSGEKVIGLALLGAREDDEHFDQTQRRFCREFSEYAASRAESAYIIEKMQNAKEYLDRTLSNLAILYDVGRSLIHVNDLKALLMTILNKAITATSAQKGSIMLWDPTINQLVIRVVQGLPDKEAEDRINRGEGDCATFAPGQGVAGKVFVTRKPIIVNQTQGDDRWVESSASFAQSLMCVPLIVADDAIGVLNITNKEGHKAFSEEDLSMLSTLANQAAVAINNAQLYELAVTDELTKLNIRRYFNVKLEKELRRSLRYHLQLSLMILDIDHFKAVNDTYGHQAGDVVLKNLAQIIRQNIRETDVGARYGGEEFAVLLPETDIHGAFTMAERLRLTVSSTRMPRLNRPVTISLGLSSYPGDGQDPETLIAAADKALYRAKRMGRNYTETFRKI